jgi:DNA-binding transcriptional regulator YiaG
MRQKVAKKPSGEKGIEGFGKKAHKVSKYELLGGKAQGFHEQPFSYTEAEESTIPQPEEKESELAENLISELERQGPDVNSLCQNYKLRREELGRLTGFSLRALAEWASGKLPSQPAKRRLHEIRRLLDALGEIVKPDAIPSWLHQRNRAFDNLTPLQVIEFGEIDRLWAMVHDMSSGQPE